MKRFKFDHHNSGQNCGNYLIHVIIMFNIFSSVINNKELDNQPKLFIILAKSIYK